MKQRITTLLLGMVLGMALIGGSHAAASAILTATPSTQPIYVDGQQASLTAYSIGGNNYVKLRDVGEAVGFNVYWDGGAVQIESGKPYTGIGPVSQPSKQPTATGTTVTIPMDGSRYVPKDGDKIACDDGATYTITDTSGYDANMFAEGPLDPLPTAACDWRSFPEITLPTAEARHFSLPDGEYLFLRNLYETRRMQYTLMNLAGTHPDTSQGGRLRYGSKGTPYVSISLTIPDDLTAHSFWPWRESELSNNFNSCPPGKYFVEAWDVFKNGKFLYTEYKIATAI